MKKSLFTLLALLSILSLVIAGCGPTEEGAAPTAPVAEQPTEAVAQPTEAAAQPTEAVVEPTEAPTEAPAVSEEPVTIILWHQEGEADQALQFVKALAAAYSAEHPNVTFEFGDKNTETLREDFLTAGLAGSLPDLVWTVNDHAGVFADAELIVPVDDYFDLSAYVDSALAAVELNGQHWGIPISNGNHLMLIYNKNLIETPPQNTDELLQMGAELTTGDQYGLVYNQTEPFWLVPWLGGFGGEVFAEDGKTPTLNTPAMVSTLEFLRSLKDPTPIVPAESDYNGADSLFKEGKAAMIINGDWSLGGYMTETLDIGVARIPQVTATGEWPSPYTSGKFFMIPYTTAEDETKLAVVQDFVRFVTSLEKQLEMVEKLNRLPALKEALDNPLITEDPILSGSADQMVVGRPMPVVSEMRCNWDAMKPEMQAVLAGQKAAEQAAADMQTAAEACVADLE